MSAYYDLETTEEKYWLVLEIVDEDTEHPNCVGVSSIYIINEKDMGDDYVYNRGTGPISIDKKEK